jgi:hypothetical protein
MAELESTQKIRKSRFANAWKARFVAGNGAAEDGEFKLRVATLEKALYSSGLLT